MHFQIEAHSVHVDRSDPVFIWRLVASTGVLARSNETYQSEALARGAIAQFKRSASGARFAKVMGPV